MLGTSPDDASRPQTPLWIGNDWGACLSFPRTNQGLFVNVELPHGIDGTIADSLLGIGTGRLVFSYLVFCTSFANVNFPVAISGGSALTNVSTTQLYMESGNQLALFARDDAAHTANPIGSGNLNDGRRHSLAMVADGTTLYGYLDGVLNKTASIATLGGTVLTRLTIGNTGQQQQTEQWRGTIDQALIWNRAISAEEILMLHRAPFAYLGT